MRPSISFRNNGVRRALRAGAAAAAVLAAFFAVHPVFAAAPQGCILKKQLDALQSAQRSLRSESLESIRAELSIRKDILRTTIGCITNEISATQENLRTLPMASGEVSLLRAQYAGTFDDFRKYIDVQKAKLQDVGIKGSQDLARALKEWRISAYAPFATTTQYFALWAKNQPLLKTADRRLEQVGDTMKSLNLADNDDLQTIYTKAQESRDISRVENDKAFSALKSFGADEDPYAHITKSLDALAQMYRNFFELSDAVKKMLPP